MRLRRWLSVGFDIRHITAEIEPIVIDAFEFLWMWVENGFTQRIVKLCQSDSEILGNPGVFSLEKVARFGLVGTKADLFVECVS